MKTKIMHLISSLAMGGAETLVTDYAMRINKDKFEFTIVTISERKGTVNEKKLEKEGVKVIFLGDKIAFPNATNILKRFINKIHRYVLFYKVVNQVEPQIIHTHLSTNGYLIPINTKKKNINIYHTIHNEVNIMFGNFKRKFPARYCVKHKGMIPIALHSKMQKEANSFFNTNACLVVPNAIDVKRFLNTNVDKYILFKSLKIKNDAFVLGHVGRFAEQKNHKFLINVFADVKQKRPNSHLILVGIGKLEGQIKRQIQNLNLQDSVSFLGNRGDIPDLMSIMNVFVFPSLYEGFGNVLIEAQATGIKCVASDTIPRDAFVTNLVTPLSLNDTIEKWSETIVEADYPDIIEGDLMKHDIKNVVSKLEHIYLPTGE